MRYEVDCVQKMFLGRDYPSVDAARKSVETEVRKLRRRGYTVECRRWDFSSRPGDLVYTIEAAKPVRPQD